MQPILSVFPAGEEEQTTPNLAIPQGLATHTHRRLSKGQRGRIADYHLFHRIVAGIGDEYVPAPSTATPAGFLKPLLSEIVVPLQYAVCALSGLPARAIGSTRAIVDLRAARAILLGWKQGRDKKPDICLANKCPKPPIEYRRTGTQRISDITLYLETSGRSEADKGGDIENCREAQCGQKRENTQLKTGFEQRAYKRSSTENASFNVELRKHSRDYNGA